MEVIEDADNYDAYVWRNAEIRESKEEIAISGENVDSGVFGQLFGKSGLGLREISFYPKIRVMNEHSKYVVSLDGDKISSNQVFQWRPALRYGGLSTQ